MKKIKKEAIATQIEQALGLMLTEGWTKVSLFGEDHTSCPIGALLKTVGVRTNQYQGSDVMLKFSPYNHPGIQAAVNQLSKTINAGTRRGTSCSATVWMYNDSFDVTFKDIMKLFVDTARRLRGLPELPELPEVRNNASSK